jgi:hypothetical protein
MAEYPNLQKELLENILERYPKKTDAVDAIGQALGIGKDAVYRRLRLDTHLTPNELVALSQKFCISLDAIAQHNADTFFFTFNAFSRKINTFEDFLGALYADLHMLLHIPDVKIFYASGEIPIFFYCFYPELISFKLYVWGRTIWDIPYIKEKPYSIDLIPFPSYQLSQDILNIYRRIPTIELWSLNFIDNTLNQIEYHANTKGFADSKEAVVLCDRLMELAQHMKAMATYGTKFKPGGDPKDGGLFDLYHNEMIYTNNTILVDTSVGKMVYTTFCNPNFLKTTDADICAFKEKWFMQLLARSNRMSFGGGEKAREWFFARLFRRIEATRNRVAGGLDDGYN